MVNRIKTQTNSSPLTNQPSGYVVGRSTLTMMLVLLLMASSSIVLAKTGPDNDADGIVNTIDLDDDNDGILDVNEGLIDEDSNGVPDATSADTDGDGTPDALDLDSDNDGVLDNLEARTDREAVKALDLNPNGAIDISFAVGSNGIPDVIETSPDSGVLIFDLLDTDNDGMPDSRDNDSDNDGISDLVEAGGFDADLDGRIDSFSDADGKGVDDAVQVAALPIFDTDGDGMLDFRDLDSDDDGIPDAVESGGSGNSSNVLPIDTDGDGAADYRETDSDQDGVSDKIEAGSNPLQPTDTNGDGRPDYQDSGIQNVTDSDNGTAGPSDDSGGAGVAGDGGSEDSGDADDGGDNVNDDDGSGGDNEDDVTDDGDDNTDNVDASDGGDKEDGPDFDGDGIANQIDLDDDNDGIPDTVENLYDDDKDGIADADSRDTDGDGTPDGLDLDSDNDGLLDNREGHPDFDIVLSLDQVLSGAIDIGMEVGGNGLADSLETSPDSGQINFVIQDTDGDGVDDQIDLDSDNDTIPDIIEAGGVDADGNGLVDNFSDADNDGVDDAIQASALAVFDTDGDDIADYRDTDSDGDGIPDSVEAGPMPGMPLDSDGDGTADFREQDADNDSVPDNQEVGADPANPLDSDGDGVPDFQDSNVSTGAPIAEPVSDDVDNDGVPNDMDLDDDNDGLLDSVEGEGDSDHDTTADKFDLDSDNDGVTDLAEAAQVIEDVRSLDTDDDGRLDSAVGANGFADELESTPDSGTSTFIVADSDGDRIPDFQDLDSDNDGIFDALESGRVNTNTDGRLVTAANTSGLVSEASNALIDTDSDGVFDNRDLDSDNDGLVDVLEAGSTDDDGDGQIDQFADVNGDGADDGLQRVTANVIDTDADRVPDYLDLDSDQDSLSDQLESQGGARDLDNDGVLDNFVDADGDGLDDDIAANPVGERDTDQDGIPDQLDLDSDGDGVSDLVEAGGTDDDNDGIVDILRDSDNDAIPDNADASITRGEDSDQDGIDDMFDASITGGNDADGDGITDDFDPDSDGNGFVGPGQEVGQGVPIQLPDTDNDGTPDVLQSDGMQSDGMQSDGMQSDAVSSSVKTGLTGHGFGCTMSAAPKSTDPMLLLLLLASVASILWRSVSRLTKTPRSINLKSVRNAGIFCAVVSSLAVSGCSTSDGADAHKGRFYIGAGGLVSTLEPDADDDDTVEVDETQSAGGSVQLGYDISNLFSIELHGSELGEATLEQSESMDPAGSIGYQVAGLSALMYLKPDAYLRGRREGFSAFGRLGGGTMWNQGEDGVRFERENDFHVLGGLGLEYGFRSGLAVRGEVIAHDTDARFGQLGLLYRFGSAGAAARVPSPRIEVPTPADPEPAVEPAPSTTVPLDSGMDLDADGDGDGVANAVDACPDSVAGEPVNDSGCAVFNGVIEGINFESGSDTLTSNAEQILSGVASTLLSYPDVRVAVEAHTDNQGSAESNLQLSKRRAIAVARFLVEQGVDGPRLQPRAFGESQPRETNATASGRARNRRVEFQVVQ